MFFVAWNPDSQDAKYPPLRGWNIDNEEGKLPESIDSLLLLVESNRKQRVLDVNSMLIQIKGREDLQVRFRYRFEEIYERVDEAISNGTQYEDLGPEILECIHILSNFKHVKTADCGQQTINGGCIGAPPVSL